MNYFLKKKRDRNKKYIFYIASQTKFDLEELIDTKLDFCGAIFSQVIYNNKLHTSGLVVMELAANMQMEFIESIADYTFKENAFDHCKSIICIVEGISSYNESFIEQLFAQVDTQTNIVGGGAGFLQNSAGGVLFNSKGYFTNSALLIKIDQDIQIGVQHGCQVLSGPYVATQCEHNILKKIDYKNALEVYKKAIYEDCQEELTLDNFQKLSKQYPIGIMKYNSEQIARDPIYEKNGELFLAGEIKDNAVLNILKVDKDSMLEASKQAASQAIKDDSNMVILFNCTARVEYLKEKFDEELDNISSITKRSTTFGAVTMGEIANSGNRYINFYNYTCVIGALCI